MPIVLRAAAGSFHGAMYVVRETGRALNATSILLLLEYLTLSHREKHWYTLDMVDEKSLVWLIQRLQGVYRTCVFGHAVVTDHEDGHTLFTPQGHVKCLHLTNRAFQLSERANLPRIRHAIGELHSEIEQTIVSSMHHVDASPDPALLDAVAELKQSPAGCRRVIDTLAYQLKSSKSHKKQLSKSDRQEKGKEHHDNSRMLQRLERLAYDPDFADPNELAQSPTKSVSERILGAGSWSLKNYVQLLFVCEDVVCSNSTNNGEETMRTLSSITLDALVEASGLSRNATDGTGTRRSRQLPELTITEVIHASQAILKALPDDKNSERMYDVLTHCLTSRTQTLREAQRKQMTGGEEDTGKNGGGSGDDGNGDNSNNSRLHRGLSEFVTTGDLVNCLIFHVANNKRSPKLFNLVYQGHKDISHLHLKNYTISQLLEMVRCFADMNHQHKQLFREIDEQLADRLSIPFDSNVICASDFVAFVRRFSDQQVFPVRVLKKLYQEAMRSGPYRVLEHCFADKELQELYTTLWSFLDPPSAWIALVERYAKKKKIYLEDVVGAQNLYNDDALTDYLANLGDDPQQQSLLEQRRKC